MASSPRIAVSSSNQARLAWAWRELSGLAGESGALVLVPARGAGDDFTRAGCPSGGGLLGLQCLTLPQLAATLAADWFAGEGLAPLSRLGSEALAARVVHLAPARLAYFAPVAGMPGFPRALASTLAELRLAEVTPARLERRGAPGKDLALLLERYERELAERRLADLAAIYRLAAEVDRHRLLGLPTLLLDVPLLSACERALARKIAALAPSLLATALAGDDTAIRGLEETLGAAAESLDSGGPHNALERVRRFVFLPQSPPPQAADSSVEFYSAAGEGLECVEIARRIAALAAAGMPFDEMAILLRGPDDYLPLVEDALRRARIPAYFTRGALRPDPAGRAFLALLECKAQNLAASRFAEYLSLGQAPRQAAPEVWAASEDEVHTGARAVESSAAAPALEPETDDSPVIAGTLRAPSGWEKLLVDAAVIGGYDRWRRRLRGLEAEFQVQLRGLRGEDEPRRHHLERQIERLRALEQFALPLIDALDALPAQASWGQWLEALSRLAGMALRAPEPVAGVLAELNPMAEVGPVGIDEVRAVLSERLRFLRREPPASRYGRVFVSSIAEAAARSFEVVFLPGLAEGLFPRKTAEDPLLLDDHRRAMDSQHLIVQQDRILRERLLLRLAAGVARSKLLVSYPRTDAIQGRTRVPSFYALEVLRAAEGHLPDLRMLEKRAAQASASRLGWPAPPDPQDAIDDAEHDLALLEPLLHAPAGSRRGHGKYLLEANPHLARSLRTRGRRWRNFWSEADGIVSPDAATAAVLARHRLSQRPYSASGLQQFAACPYRFLLSAIHGLRAREQAAPLEQLDPLTRGGLFHAAQFRIFRELEAGGLLPVAPANLDRVLDVADGVLDRVAAEYKEDLAPAIPRVWDSEMENLRTDLRAWIRQLVPIHAVWRPAHFELAFGMHAGQERDPGSRREEVRIFDGIRLRGSIDLVEVHASGALRVTDHKTGKAPWPEPAYVGGGEALQPLLYSLAAEQMLDKTAHSGLLYYCTQRGNYTQVEIPVVPQSRAYLKEALRLIDASIEEGFLPAAPRPDACEYCDYRPICGPYEEQRVRQKKKDALVALQTIRNMP
ncbi:MAG: PD-(D/E)XK nuclease family protein [Acidobacteria bacterium]|nr:PD-(D/E)XK nuclease family protein [Acidobacteriota bacterium]